jgi:GNAT superfamily N-acetyltransferase
MATPQRSRASTEIVVRRARPEDGAVVAPLLHMSAEAMYDRFAGGRGRAVRVLERAFAEPGTNASAETVWVAEVEGRVIGALAAFPVHEGGPRSKAILRLTLRSIPFWRWPTSLRLYWAGARATPSPPGSSLYVDALAVDPAVRRQGAARALLAAAEERARSLGLPAVALDTTLDNRPARSLYLSAGYDEVAYKPAGRGLPGFVALVKEL